MELSKFRERGVLSTRKKVVKVMKITAFILLVGCLQVSAFTNAQVKIDVKNAPLENVLDEVANQAGVFFLYNSKDLASIRVTVVLQNVSVKEALNVILENTHLTYAIDGKNIVIQRTKKTISKDNEIQTHLPDSLINIQGQVIGSDNKSIAGATVTIKGTEIGTSTQADGSFFLSGVKRTAVLMITSVGYESKTVQVNGKSSIVVQLSVSAQQMKEVTIVNTGYQQLPKERATGSFVSIDNELFNRRVSPNVLDRIYDVTSGLSYTNSANNNSNVPPLTIRGISTINSNKSPLIVVDNFPFEGPIASINPNDVYSVTVLKDAAAASIWGVRAGNGVIIITTKKGKLNQKPKIDANFNLTVLDKPNLSYIPIIASDDFVKLEMTRFDWGNYNFALRNRTTFPVVSNVVEVLNKKREGVINETTADSLLNLYSNHDIRNDINAGLLQKAINKQLAVSVSGGSNSFSYLGSVGYDFNIPNEIENESQRITLRLNNLWKPVKGLEVNIDFYYTKSDAKNSGLTYNNFLPTGRAKVSPYTFLSDKNGDPVSIPWQYRTSYTDTAKFPNLLDWSYVPFDEIKENYSRSNLNDTRINGLIRYSPINGVTVNLAYQYQNIHSQSTSESTEKSYSVRNAVNSFMNVDGSGQTIYPFPLGRILNISNSELRNWNYRFQINYDKFWNNHNITLLGGYELRETVQNIVSSSIIGFNPETYQSPFVDFTTIFPLRPFGSGTLGGGRQTSKRETTNRNGSYFANGAYTYFNKYIFTASGRMDQSNFFGVKANQRRVPLWSTGIAWIISKEAFFSSSWIDFLKFRYTYGYNGNTNNSVSSYATIAYGANGTFIPNRELNASVILPPNPELRWEKINVQNWALDFEILSRRINGSFEYYNKKSSDLLGPITLDPTTGFSSFVGNQSGVKGNGIDLSITSINIKNRNIEWFTDFLLSFNKEKVTAYYQEVNQKGAILVAPENIIVGQPLYQLSTFKMATLDPTSGDPRVYLADTISSYLNYFDAKSTDIIIHGSRMPRIFGSLRNSFVWKGVSISANVTFKLKYYFLRSTVNYQELFTNWSGHNDYGKRWIKPGDEKITNIPSLPSAIIPDRDAVSKSSNLLVEKGDHIRLQDIKVSYDLSALGSKIKISSAQIYFYVNNIGIIWRANNKGIDPEAYSFGSMPAQRSYAIGLNVSF